MVGHPRLANVGGAISPEMEIPKLLWLKENLPGTFGATVGAGAKGKALDLSDFLAYKAVDGKGHARSLCTTVRRRPPDGGPDPAQPQPTDVCEQAVNWAEGRRDRTLFLSTLNLRGGRRYRAPGREG